MAIRKFFKSGNLKLSYLDFGGNSNNILVCLHGHFGNGRMFSRVASSLKDWKVYAIDQRGHGWSEHPVDLDYSRESYLNDIFNFVKEINASKITILGHSLGGVNAYQFASKYPELVNAMIIEDIGAEVNGDNRFAINIPKNVESLKGLKGSLLELGISDTDYFCESAYETESGWSFRFDCKGMDVSHQFLNGNWWKDWTISDCPALLIHGLHSWVVKTEQIEKMARIRPNTKLKVFEESGHTIHDDNFDGFKEVVIDFLYEVSKKSSSV